MRNSTLVRSGLTLAVAAFALAAMPSASHAADANADLTINATVQSRATLTLNPTTITFTANDPGNLVPSVPAAVDVTASIRTGNGVTPTLTVIADGPLTDSGTGATIPVDVVTWTASGAPFVDGTMSSATPQSAATFGTGSQTANGSFSFFFADSWTHPVGNFTATATYTLSAP